MNLNNICSTCQFGEDDVVGIDYDDIDIYDSEKNILLKNKKVVGFRCIDCGRKWRC